MIKGKLLKILNGIQMRELSGDEIQKQLGYQPVLYEDLANMNTIDDLLNRGNGISVILLYQNTRYSGHYTLIYKTNLNGQDGETIRFFDPYGMKYDHELQYLSMSQPAHLTRLLTGRKVVCNLIPLQKYGNKIQDCGTHCITRLLFRHLSNEEYERLLKENEQVINADQIVLLMNLLTIYYEDISPELKTVLQ